MDLDRNIRVRIDGSGSTTGARQVNRALNDIKTQGRATKRSISTVTSALFSLKAAFLSLGAGMAVRSLVTARKHFDGISASLEFLTGSTEGANQAMEFIEHTADRLGQSVEVLSSSYVRMMGSARGTSITQKELNDIFLGTIEAMSTFSQPAEATERSLYAIGQMMSKGKVLSEDYSQQLGESLPGSAAMGAKAINGTTEAFLKMMSDGKLGLDFLRDWARVMREDFAESAEIAADKIGGQFTRMGNAIHQLKVDIANSGILDPIIDGVKAVTVALGNEEFLGAIRTGVTGAADAIKMLINNVTLLVQGLALFAGMRLAGLFAPLVVGAWNSVAALTALDIAIFKGMAGMTAYGMAITVTTRALTALKVAASFMGGIPGVIIGIAGAFYLYNSRVKDAAENTRDLTDEYELLIKGMSKLKVEQAQDALQENLIQSIIHAGTLNDLLERRAEIQGRVPTGGGSANERRRVLVANELAAVTREIEQAQGALRDSGNQTSMATEILKRARERLEAAQAEAAGGGGGGGGGGDNKASDAIRQMVKDLQDQAAMFGLSDTQAIAYRVTLGDLATDIKAMGAAGQQAAADMVRYTAKLQLAEEQADKLADAQDLWKETVESTNTPLDDHLARLEELRDIEAELLANREGLGITSAQVVSVVQQGIEQEIAAYKGLQDQADETFSAMEEFSIQAARNMQTAMADFFVGAMEGSFDGLLESFRDMVRRMVAEIAAKQVLSWIMTAANTYANSGGSGGGSAGIVGTLFSGRGRMNSAGGNALEPGRLSMVGEYEPEMFFGRSGAIPLGLGGPEVFRAPEAGVIKNQAQMARGRSAGMSVSITNNGAPAKVESARVDSTGNLQVVLADAYDQFVDRLVDEMASGYGNFVDGVTTTMDVERSVG